MTYCLGNETVFELFFCILDNGIVSEMEEGHMLSCKKEKKIIKSYVVKIKLAEVSETVNKIRRARHINIGKV